jgi:hypothetical protein
MSKRLFKIGSVIALLLAVPVVSAVMEPTIDWQVFEKRLPAIFESSNINVLGVVTEGTEGVPLPFAQRMRSFVSWRKSGPLTGSWASESVSHWTLKCIGGPVLEILARYHEGKAVCMVIRSTDSAEKKKRGLRDEIAKAFPYLKIILEDICPPHGSGAPF